MIKIFTVAFLVFLVSIAIARGQYLLPTSYNMGNAALGVPQYFDAVFENTENVPVLMTGSACIGYADMDITWFHKSDNTRFDSTLVPAGASVEIVVRMVPVTQGFLMMDCQIGVFDASMNVVGGQYYTIAGGVSATPNISLSPSDLIFDETEPGASSIKTVVLRNTGTGDAHVFVPTNNLTPFSIDSSGPWVVKSMDSITVNVTFAPTTSGDASTVIEFAHVFLPRDPKIQVQLHGSTGSAEPEIFSLSPSVDFSDVPLGDSTSASVMFEASTEPVNVVGVVLSDGSMFSIVEPTFPTIIEASGYFVVFVGFASTTAGEFLDTLVLTTEKGSIIRVPLRARVLPVSVSEAASVSTLRPNPSSGEIHWTGKPLELLRIVNSIGEVVTTAVADDDGNGSCYIDLPGVYALVSERSGTATTFVIVR